MTDTEDSTPTEPWPHEWRPQMRLVPVPERGQPALLVYEVVSGALRCIFAEGRPLLWTREPSDPLNQPDLDDGGTRGVLLGMVRDALKAARGEQLAEIYALTFRVLPGEDGPINGWFDSITGRCFAKQGIAYKAALDHLASKETTNAPTS